MKIIALKYYKNGEMQEAFAMGGSMNPEKIDMNKRYPSSLQNYLIDTGKEVILIDTGLPKETPDSKKHRMPSFMSERKSSHFRRH
jgi:N-acyl homoserine lactone hydrolase